MRVLFWKIGCPGFVCFCKPSPSIYTPGGGGGGGGGSLRLEAAPSPSNASSDSSSSSDPDPDPPEETTATTQVVIIKGGGESGAQGNRGEQSNGDHNCLKSSIRRAGAGDRHASQEVEKKKKSKRVQWVDHVIGEQLAEVREFESSEREDADSGYRSSRSCLCTIL